MFVLVIFINLIGYYIDLLIQQKYILKVNIND
jgi:hypothetical protein